MLIDPSCPVCRGTGTLHFGRAAEAQHTPEVVSRAVEYSIEAAARAAIAADPTAAGIHRARQRITNTIRTLTIAGVLHDHPTPPRPRARTTPAHQHTAAVALTRKLPVDTYHRGDAAALDAPPLEFAVDDRPLAQGGIPGFSSGGYVCHLTRAADPIDPLQLDTANPTEQGTAGTYRRRYVTDRRARALAEATTAHLW